MISCAVRSLIAVLTKVSRVFRRLLSLNSEKLAKMMTLSFPHLGKSQGSAYQELALHCSTAEIGSLTSFSNQIPTFSQILRLLHCTKEWLAPAISTRVSVLTPSLVRTLRIKPKIISTAYNVGFWDKKSRFSSHFANGHITSNPERSLAILQVKHDWDMSVLGWVTVCLPPFCANDSHFFKISRPRDGVSSLSALK
jgi:hypothetical protein